GPPGEPPSGPPPGGGRRETLEPPRPGLAARQSARERGRDPATAEGHLQRDRADAGRGGLEVRPGSRGAEAAQPALRRAVPAGAAQRSGDDLPEGDSGTESAARRDAVGDAPAQRRDSAVAESQPLRRARR